MFDILVSTQEIPMATKLPTYLKPLHSHFRFWTLRGETRLQDFFSTLCTFAS